jgi:hypothetical protein
MAFTSGDGFKLIGAKVTWQARGVNQLPHLSPTRALQMAILSKTHVRLLTWQVLRLY